MCLKMKKLRKKFARKKKVINFWKKKKSKIS